MRRGAAGSGNHRTAAPASTLGMRSPVRAPQLAHTTAITVSAHDPVARLTHDLDSSRRRPATIRGAAPTAPARYVTLCSSRYHRDPIDNATRSGSAGCTVQDSPSKPVERVCQYREVQSAGGI